MLFYFANKFTSNIRPSSDVILWDNMLGLTKELTKIGCTRQPCQG